MKTIFLLSMGAFLPLAFVIFLVVFFKKRCNITLKPFITGAVCFVVFAMFLEQICHALILPKVSGSVLSYILYSAFAAGIFEESARLLGFGVVLKKQNDKNTALAYGVGHGGIEMILLLSLNCFLMLSAYLNADFGSLEANISLVSAALSLTPYSLVLSFWERISALLIHLGLSCVVFTAVKKHKIWLYFASICLHALADLPVGLYQTGAIKSILLLECIIFAFALACFAFGIKILNKECDN